MPDKGPSITGSFRHTMQEHLVDGPTVTMTGISGITRKAGEAGSDANTVTVLYGKTQGSSAPQRGHTVVTIRVGQSPTHRPTATYLAAYARYESRAAT